MKINVWHESCTLAGRVCNQSHLDGHADGEDDCGDCYIAYDGTEDQIIADAKARLASRTDTRADGDSYAWDVACYVLSALGIETTWNPATGRYVAL